MTCPCGETPRDAYLCRPCTDTLRRDLRDCAWLLGQLEIQARRQGVGAQGGSNGKPGSRMPVDLDAAQAASQIRATVWGMARMVVEDVGKVLPDEAILAPGLWLAENIATVRQREWAPDMLTELRDRTTHGRRLIDTHADLRIKCDCGERVTIQHDEMMTCRGCGETGVLSWWIERHGAQLAPVKLAELPLMLMDGHGIRVTTGQLRKWLERGWITPVQQGPSRFDVVAVVAVARERLGRRAA